MTQGIGRARGVAAGVVIAAAACAPAAPTTRPAAPPDLDADARRIAAETVRRLGEGYTSQIDAERHIVYVSALDAANLRHAMTLLGDYHDALRRDIFAEPARWNITVVMPTVTDYRRFVPRSEASGVYSPRSRTLLTISFSSTLIHEFTHALHHVDRDAAGQKHAIWVAEGLATLFEGSRLEAGRIDIRLDDSLVVLQAALQKGEAHTLADFCRLDPRQFMASAKVSYAQARYVMLYLRRQGKLRAFYTAYKRTFAEDPTGVKALEAALGVPLARIEADWREWVLALEPPWRPLNAPRPHLGIRMRKVPGGVEVTGALPGSVADRAGVLRKGDVVIAVAGRPVRSAADLALAVRDHQPGQIVSIEVIRDDRTVVLRHVLGAYTK